MTLSVLLILAVVGGIGWHYVAQRRRVAASTWAMAVLVTDVAQLARFQDSYNDVRARIQWVRPDTIQSPVLRAAVRIHPGPLPKPYTTGWGKVWAPGAMPDVIDPFGTIVLRADKQAWFDHEAAHAITGIPDHPPWLFRPDGSLNV